MRGSRRNKLILLGTLAAFVIAGIAFFQFPLDRSTKSDVVNTRPVKKTIEQEIDEVILEMRVAFGSGVSKHIKKYFATDQLVVSAKERGFHELDVVRIGERRIHQLEKAILHHFATDWSRNYAWIGHDVIKIKSINDSMVEVYSVHASFENPVERGYHWWFVRQDGKWKFFDLHVGYGDLRFSSSWAVDYLATGLHDNAWAQPFLDLQQEYDALADLEDWEPEFKRIERKKRQFLRMSIPDDVREFCHLWSADHWNSTVDGSNNAIWNLDQIQSGGGISTPHYYYLRSLAVFGESYFHESMSMLDCYAEYYGRNPMVYSLMADVCIEMKDIEQAMQYAQLGLDCDCYHVGCLLRLAITLPEDQKSQMDPYLAIHMSMIDVMSHLIFSCNDCGDEVAARHVYEMLRKASPDDERTRHYQELFDQ